MKTMRDGSGYRCPQGWALPGALLCILVQPHPASWYVAGNSALPTPLRASAGSTQPLPLLSGYPGHARAPVVAALWQRHAVSPWPKQGTMAEAASQGLSRGAQGAWAGRWGRDVGGHVGPHRVPLPVAPAGASLCARNERARTAPGSTAQMQPVHRGVGKSPSTLHRGSLPGPQQSPQAPVLPAPGPSGRAARAGPCSASGHRERDPLPRHQQLRNHSHSDGGDTSGDDRGELGVDGGVTRGMMQGTLGS